MYGFFHPVPKLEVIEGRRAHVFKCQNHSCKTAIRHFLDKGDARSTGNMRRHVKKCWGIAARDAADSAKKFDDVKKLVRGILRDGTITDAFEKKGMGKPTYSNRPLTRAETKAAFVRWVCESLRPFDIVKDVYFLVLMKTGRLALYIPSPSTVSRDVRLVFART